MFFMLEPGELALIGRARRSAATALAAGALLAALVAPGTVLGATTLTPVVTGLSTRRSS